MPPPRTGYVEPFKRADGTTYYRARIRLGDDSRQRVDVPEKYCTPAGGRTARERAELYAQAVQEDEDETGKLLAKKRAREAEEANAKDPRHAETSTKYFDRLSSAREAEGVRDIRKERTIWGKWISPRIGTRPIAAVTRDEIEAIRDALDVEVRKRIKDGLGAGISGDTAENVWSVLRTTFKESVSSRDRTLRARTDDPTHGHKPPLKTPARGKTFVYPSEFARLLACTQIPLEWREAYAIAAYTYVRPEELQALTRKDVDLEADVVHVSKAIDPRTRKVKIPKTPTAVRSIPIEPSLRPLLEGICARNEDGDAPVVPILGTLNDKFRAKLFREHLRRAGIVRPRLFAETVTLRQVDFRSCRDSGITWLALAGVPLAAMQRRCGHTEISQTLAYVKMAEDLTGKVGSPFAPLPPDLSAQGSAQVPQIPQKPRETWVPEEGVERAESAEFTAIRVDDAPESAARVDVSKRTVVTSGPSEMQTRTVEDELATALAEAAKAHRWDVVSQLSRELEARRLAGADVADLGAERARRGRRT